MHAKCSPFTALCWMYLGTFPYTPLIRAQIASTYTAAQLAGCLMKPGQKNTDVTAALKTVADAYGVNVVQGSLMHQMKRFVIDGNKVIIGREELDQKVEEFEFEANEVYCVDVCMSTGEGKPKDSEERTCVF